MVAVVTKSFRKPIFASPGVVVVSMLVRVVGVGTGIVDTLYSKSASVVQVTGGAVVDAPADTAVPAIPSASTMTASGRLSRDPIFRFNHIIFSLPLKLRV